MVLYNALTVVYLYERSLHIVFCFFLVIFVWIHFVWLFVIIIFISKPGRPLCSLFLPLSLLPVGAFSSLITWHLCMLSGHKRKTRVKGSNRRVAKRPHEVWLCSFLLSSSSPPPCSISSLVSAVEHSLPEGESWGRSSRVWSQQTFHYSFDVVVSLKVESGVLLVVHTDPALVLRGNSSQLTS